MYTYEEVYNASVNYFNGDELAAKVFVDKYALKNNNGEYLELTPKDMHKRLSKEFARIESKYSNPISEEEIFNLLDNYKYIVPQGSPMSAIGNPYQVQSLSNCFVIQGVNEPKYDSYGGIMLADQHLAQIFKRRGGCGLDISGIRPKGMATSNAAKTTDGIGVFMERFSNTCREAAQCLHKDTLVLTLNGLKLIKDINVNDKVWTNNKWVNVDNILKNKKNIYKIKTKHGKEILASNDHIFHCIDKERKVKDFKIGDGISQIVGEGWFGKEVRLNDTISFNNTKTNKNVKLPKILNTKLAYILGQMYGDGYVEKSENAITIASSDDWKDIENKIKKYVFDTFNYDVKIQNRKNERCSKIGIYSKEIIAFLKHNNILKQKADNIIFPEALLLSNKEIVFSFISGFFDADGYVSSKKKSYKISSINEKFLQTIQTIFSSYGIISRISVEKRGNNWKDLYSLLINGQASQDIFRSLMIESIKITSTKFTSKTKDHTKSIYNIKDFGSNSTKHKYIIDNNQKLSYSSMLKAKSDLNLNKNTFLFYDSIGSIENLHIEDDVYDLVLSSEHLFFANGLYAHNSGRRGALMITIDVSHPEIETFINIKKDKTKVTGANISIKITDEFMNSVKNKEKYTLRYPTKATVSEAKFTKEINAKDLWDKLIEAAWESAEPGLLFWDTVTKNTPSDIYKDFGYESISTNPCIVGSTLIATADGRNAVSIKQLVAEGKDVPVYSTNLNTGVTEIKYGRNPRKTGNKVEVWKLTLDDGSSLIATPNHKILTKDLKYVELKDLDKGASIYPFYSFDSNGYRQVSNTGAKMKGGAIRNRRQYRLIYEFNNPEINVDAKKYAIHHKDFNSRNDNISNLQLISHEEHNKIHSEKMIGLNNPYHKMSDEWKRNFASHPGDKNGRWIDVSNEELIAHGKELFQKCGYLNEKNWYEYAKENNLPKTLSNKSRFGNFTNFKNQVSENHKVESVEFYGYEDVYNITVDDNNNYHIITSNEDDKFVTSSGICIKNCGEIVLSPGDACRLLCLNLESYVKNPFKSNSYFDYNLFKDHVIKAQRLMDDIVDLELEAVQKIINKIESDPEDFEVKQVELKLWKDVYKTCESGRRTGLGITALGDCLASLEIKYGSDESIDETYKIYRALAVGAYTSTVIMAKERGSFSVFNYELEKDHKFLNDIFNDCDLDTKNNWKLYGRRNISLTTTAPTGSVATQTQTTSGIEPVYLLSYMRRKKINPSDVTARVDFVDQMGDKWQEFTVYHHGVKKWMDATGEADITKSPYYGATSNDIDWIKSVEIQAAAQKSICHSISKTCVTRDTLIETENGLLYLDEIFNIDSIKTNESLKNLNNIKVKNCHGNFVEPSHFHNMGINKIINLSLDNGLSIKVTPKERFLVLNDDTGVEDWKYIEDIELGDRVKIS